MNEWKKKRVRLQGTLVSKRAVLLIDHPMILSRQQSQATGLGFKYFFHRNHRNFKIHQPFFNHLQNNVINRPETT